MNTKLFAFIFLSNYSLSAAQRDDINKKFDKCIAQCNKDLEKNYRDIGDSNAKKIFATFLLSQKLEFCYITCSLDALSSKIKNLKPKE